MTNLKSQLATYIRNSNNEIKLALGEFKIADKIGEGCNGIVYEAKIFDQIVAIKFLTVEKCNPTTKLKRFWTEYFNVLELSDKENIVLFYGYDVLKFNANGKEMEWPLIIMKRYSSCLKKHITNGEINKEKFEILFNFLIDSIEKIHDAGIIHRDLKPENILIDGDNNKFVLADFGIASYHPDVFIIRPEAGNNDRMANRLFSAPEQENKGEKAHHRMDIYALGQILHWYVNGEPHKGTGRKRITEILEGMDTYDVVIDRCLQQNPENRFQSIAELKAALVPPNKKGSSNYLNLFHTCCCKNFPKNNNSIVPTNDKNKIDKLLHTLKEKADEFNDKLCKIEDGGQIDINTTLQKKENAIWKIRDWEFEIEDIWVHFNTSVKNDFILVHFCEAKPFIIGENSEYRIAIMDDKYYISISEMNNGFAEIENEIWDLKDHKVEEIIRQDQEGYFFIGTEYNNIRHQKSEVELKGFLSNLLERKQEPTIDELIAFRNSIGANSMLNYW